MERRRTRLEFCAGNRRVELYAVVAASSLQLGERNLALLIIEVMHELTDLRRMVPVCSVCHSVGDEEAHWSRMESYFERRWGLNLARGICPDCERKELDRLKLDEVAVAGNQDSAVQALPLPAPHPVVPAAPSRRTGPGFIRMLRQTLAACRRKGVALSHLDAA